MRSLPTLLCLCLIGGPLVAQTSWFPPIPDEERVRPGERVAGEHNDLEDASEAPRESAIGPSKEVMLVATTVPSRIPPGGAGTMVITMAMRGSVLITADTPIQPAYAEKQGHLTLGRHTLRPAKPNPSLGPPLLGQPVYDRSAIMEIPIHVGIGAALGKHAAVVRLRFELKDTEGTSLGQFANAVGAQVRVGESVAILASDASSGGARPTESLVTSVPETEAGALAPPETTRAVGTGRGVMRTVPADLVGSAAPDSDIGFSGIPGYSPQVPLMLWLLLGAGGLAILACATLLMRRLLKPAGSA